MHSTGGRENGADAAAEVHDPAKQGESRGKEDHHLDVNGAFEFWYGNKVSTQHEDPNSTL